MKLRYFFLFLDFKDTGFEGTRGEVYYLAAENVAMSVSYPDGPFQSKRMSRESMMKKKRNCVYFGAAFDQLFGANRHGADPLVALGVAGHLDLTGQFIPTDTAKLTN